jgi:hypothetical protein
MNLLLLLMDSGKSKTVKTFSVFVVTFYEQFQLKIVSTKRSNKTSANVEPNWYDKDNLKNKIHKIFFCVCEPNMILVYTFLFKKKLFSILFFPFWSVRVKSSTIGWQFIYFDEKKTSWKILIFRVEQKQKLNKAE